MTRIICLLPVRDAAPLLPEWLDEAAAFADAVVALDDGSTDETGAILRAHPLVARILTNERRDGFLGWHDGRNRNRLLAASADLHPDWILSLDADERIDASDAEALRRFVDSEALGSCAYGFQLYRMVDDEQYDPQFEWVFRLFRFRDGQRFRNRRFDLVPVPTSIDPRRWVQTTLRIKHYEEPAGRAAMLAKYREADPEGAFRSYYENLRTTSLGPYARWQPRAPQLPFLYAETPAGALSSDGTRQRSLYSLVCLLPARNCVHLLDGYFESVARFADAVVALDDGSTDGTGEYLRNHPLVAKLLTNPPRDGYGSWDDGLNRNDLLAAAAELAPEWIISLDADERVPLEDAVALRRFLRLEAERRYAYGLASYRMIGDEDHYDRLDYHAYRLFAWEPGHVFPSDPLHAPPIPTAIPPHRWRMTTLRMKHLASLTEDDRRARFEKYRQADPAHEWEPDYAYTVEPPGDVKPWPRRGPGTSAVAADWNLDPVDEAAALDLHGPVQSVALVVAPDEEDAACAFLRALGDVVDERTELLVVTRDPYAAEVIGAAGAHATVADVDPALSDVGLRNAALQRARGDYVAFLPLDARIDGDGVGRIAALHEAGFGVVAARTDGKAARTDALDGGAATTYVSFAREPLLQIGGYDERAGRSFDLVAAHALLRLGLRSAVVDGVVVPRRQEASGVRVLVDGYRLASALARMNGDGGRSPSAARAATAAWAASLRQVVRAAIAAKRHEQHGAPPGALL